MKKLLVIALIVCLGTAQAEVHVPSKNLPQHLLKVAVPDKAAYLRLMETGLDIPEQLPGLRMDVIASDPDAEWLQAQGFEVEFEIRNLQRHFATRAQGASAATMGGYRTLAEVEAAVDSIIAAYPSIVSPKYNIGTTVLGRPIHAIRISDHPTVDEGEVGVLFDGCHHAREVITPHLLIYTMQQLVQGYGSDTMLTRLVDEREIWFVPVVNPDGYYHNQVIAPSGGGLWRKNRRDNLDGNWGVDLNRNYDYAWGTDDVGSSPFTWSETYRGTAGFSEPETQVMRDFCMAHPNLRIVVNYHSYGNLFLYPWGYVRSLTPDHALFKAIADSAVTFNGYTAQPGWGLYLTNGGSDDWMYGALGLLSFTPEVGTGQDFFWPDVSRIEPLTLENYPVNIFLLNVADGPERLLPPEPSVWDSIVVVGDDSLYLDWSNPDTSINAPVNYDVIELSDPQLVTDDLESGVENWDLLGSSAVQDVSFSGITSLYTQTGDDFTSYITSVQPYTVQAGDTLRFQTLYSIQDGFDYAYVQISTDGGQSFASIPGSNTTMDDPNGQNLGNGITGNSVPWSQVTYDLSAYEGQDIHVRIAYITDSWINNYGMYIDDVWPVRIFGQSDHLLTTTGTSTVVDNHPPGAYFFRILATDVHGQQSASPTLNFSYIPAYTNGDADNSGAISSADIVYMVNYIFKGGPEPQPVPQSGEVDGSGVTNSADIVYLVNYVFKGGPAPVEF